MRYSFSDLLSILFWAALGGVIVWGSGVAADKKAETKRSARSATQRRQEVQDAVKAGPQLLNFHF